MGDGLLHNTALPLCVWLQRVLHAYMAHPNPINMLGARAVPTGAAVAASAELCGRVEESGDGGRGGRAGQSAELPRRQLLMTMYHVVAPTEDTWTYLFRCTTAAVGRLVLSSGEGRSEAVADVPG